MLMVRKLKVLEEKDDGTCGVCTYHGRHFPTMSDVLMAFWALLRVIGITHGIFRVSFPPH